MNKLNEDILELIHLKLIFEIFGTPFKTLVDQIPNLKCNEFVLQKYPKNYEIPLKLNLLF